MRRLAGALGILVTTIAFVVTAQPAAAQEAPTVRIAGTTGMSETGQAPPASTPSTQPQQLARTGSTSFTFGLVLIGLGMIVWGMTMKRVADSRIR